MDKIILVHYIDISGIEPENISVMMNTLSKKLRLNEKEVISYFIPTFTPTRVECLNPKLVSEEEFNKAKLVLNNSQKTINDFMKGFPNK